MSTLDWLIVAGYFAAIAALTSWVLKRRRDTADDYFLASRHLGWFVVGASIFASNIGSEHLVGLAGAGATRSEEHTSELQSLTNLVCRLLLEKKKAKTDIRPHHVP